MTPLIPIFETSQSSSISFILETPPLAMTGIFKDSDNFTVASILIPDQPFL